MFDAKLVFNQLTMSNNGVNRLVAMTGAKHIAQDSEKQYVSFKLPKIAKGINYVKITLNSMDLYDIEFGKTSRKQDPEMKKLGVKFMIDSYAIKKTVDNVMFDQLKSIFETETNLYLSL